MKNQSLFYKQQDNKGASTIVIKINHVKIV